MAQKRSFRDKLLLAITNSNYKDRGTIHDIVKFYAEKLTDDELMAIESLSEWAKKSDELFCQGVDSILNDDKKRNTLIFELAQAYNEKADNELEEQTQKNENLEKQLKEQNQNNEKIRNAADNQSQKNREIRGSINAIDKRKIAVPISWGFLLIGSIFMGFASVFGRWWGFSEDSISIIGAAVDAVGLAISVIFFIYEHSSDTKKLDYIDKSDQMCKDVKSLAVNIDFNQKQDNSVDGSTKDSPGGINQYQSPGASATTNYTHYEGDHVEGNKYQINKMEKQETSGDSKQE